MKNLILILLLLTTLVNAQYLLLDGKPNPLRLQVDNNSNITVKELSVKKK